MLKLTFSMFYQKSDRWLLQVLNLCACICFSFCVYWSTHTSACTKLSRYFLQAKLNCEINACFVLNELCDLYFYCKILALKLSSVKFKKKLKKKLFGRGVTYSLKRAQNCYWRMQIMAERKQQLEERFESMSIKTVWFFHRLYNTLFYMLFSFSNITLKLCFKTVLGREHVRKVQKLSCDTFISDESL